MEDTLTALKQATIERCKAQLKVKTLAKRIEEQQQLYETSSERTNFDSVNREIIRYVRPDLSEYLDTTQTKGEKRGVHMFTSKVSTDLERAADAFVGNVFARKNWFAYAMENTWANQINEIQDWLQQSKEHMYSVYNNARFLDSIMPPVTMDALSIGDGIVYLGNMDGRPYFRYCEIMACYFQRDTFGKLMRVHYVLNMTALEAWERWGEACSAEVIRAAFEHPMECFKFIHAVYKRDDPILSEINRFKIERPWIELYIQKGSTENIDVSGQNLLRGVLGQDGYHSCPYIDWPYFLKSGETYGRGPLGTALVTVKRLHAQHKSAMTAAQREAGPPLKVSELLKNRVDIRADGITWIKDAAQETMEEVYKMKGGYRFTKDYIEYTEKQLEEVLHLSLFLALSLVTKEMNNPEVYERIGEKAAMLTPRLGLMDALFLNQIHERCWQIEETAGRMPPPPPVLAYLHSLPKTHPLHVSNEVKVYYKGPLITAQEQLYANRRLTGNLQAVAMLAKFDETAASDVIDVEKAAEHILDDGDFWQDSIRDPKQRMERKQVRMQLSLAQQKAEMDAKEGTAIKNVAGAVKDME